MKKEVIVLSLGGSLIIPGDINVKYLKNLKKVLLKNTKKHKFVVVCGGGSLARKYISAIRGVNGSEKFQSFSGISATRTNARFMSYFFNQEQEQGIPHTLETLEKYLKKRDIVFCGALEYKPDQTSDSTSAQLAKHFGSIFINLSNTFGLFTKDPLKYKDAVHIPKISWKDFDKIVSAMKFKPGQHFVLDQKASRIIMKNKISTYLLGPKAEHLDKLLKGKKFKGTLISG